MTVAGLCNPASGFNIEILLRADFRLLYFNSIQLSSFIFLFLFILLLLAILQANMQSKSCQLIQVDKSRTAFMSSKRLFSFEALDFSID